MRLFRIIIDFLVVASVATLVVGAVNWYPLLPERIVMHLNGAGEPDGWAQRTPWTWGLPAGLGFILAAIFRGLIVWLDVNAATGPNALNIPDRGRFIALSVEQRRTALQPTALYLRYVAVLVLFLFIYVQEGIGRVSTGASATWPVWPVLVIVMAIIMGVPLLLRTTRRTIEGLTLNAAGKQR